MDNTKPISPTLSQRVESLDFSVARIDERLESGDAAMQQITQQLQENTEATQRIETSMSEVVEFLAAMKGAFKVFNWIGALAKPMGAIVGLGVALWGAWLAFKTGVPK